MNKINFLKLIFLYFKSLTILKKFLIPSIIGFMFFLFFYIYILSNTTTMKQNVFEVNSELIPIYETNFDNEILLEKISNELNNAVIANELQWINNSDSFAIKLRKNLLYFKNTKYDHTLIDIYNTFEKYYDEAKKLSKNLIINKENYNEIHNKTTLVVNRYNNLKSMIEKFKETLKYDIKNNINSTYSTSSRVVFNSSYAFFVWIILSSIGIVYIYKDIKSRINDIVSQSEDIASGEANFHKRLTHTSKDELGLVVNSINSFISKLEKNHNELELVKDDIKRFIEDTAHQIRTPLSNILINSEMIKTEQHNKELDPLFDSIDASIKMLSNSYEDLLYITSYDSIDYKPTNIDLSKILNDRIEFFDTICQSNSKIISSNIEENLTIYLNNIECERIIDNNISNAIKYAFIDKDITINLFCKNDKIYLVFKSFSHEIKDKQKVFEKNYREHDSLRGLGLGLNMVKNICIKNNILFKLTFEDNQNIFTYIFDKAK